MLEHFAIEYQTTFLRKLWPDISLSSISSQYIRMNTKNFKMIFSDDDIPFEVLKVAKRADFSLIPEKS
jgi:hypothetical protein